MRIVLLAAALSVLAACAPPMPPPNQRTAERSDLYRFIEPTNGAAYSQGSMYYYTNGVNPGAFGPAGVGGGMFRK
jgi:hypothetical protein